MALTATASANPLQDVEVIQKFAENQIKNLITPVIERYCPEDCRLLSVKATVDVATQEQVNPGFDELEIKKGPELSPSSALIKLLVNEQLGSNSRNKLVELFQQYLDTLDYPVRISPQLARFPLSHGTESKIAQIRAKIEKSFIEKSNSVIQQLCATSCLLTDVSLQTELVNLEELEYGNSGEFVREGDIALKVRRLSATVLMDQELSPEEQSNIVELIKLQGSNLKNVSIQGKSTTFPKLSNPRKFTIFPPWWNVKRVLASSDGTKTPSDGKALLRKLFTKERFAECIFWISLLFLAFTVFTYLMKYPVLRQHSLTTRLLRSIKGALSFTGGRKIESLRFHRAQHETDLSPLGLRYELERMYDELNGIYAQNPKVAKTVFSRVLTEEGVPTASEYLTIFGEGIMIEMLRDPTLQRDVAELLEYYSKNHVELSDSHKFNLLKRLHNKTVASKLRLFSNRSTALFDFLSDMSAEQVLELIRNESLTVKSIILAQCDPEKRAKVYEQINSKSRLSLLTELARIDHLPKDYIQNVASALKIKKRENPLINTEALPSSEVLVSLLQQTGVSMQKSLLDSLSSMNPESATTIKSKLISLDTLRFLRDGQLLEVVLSLNHDELLHLLKGTSESIKNKIYSRSSPELVAQLESELRQMRRIDREAYQTVERKVLKRIKMMADAGDINLLETNERMFGNPSRGEGPYQQMVHTSQKTQDHLRNNLRRLG
jgi:flagellar motor switch protein FliG